MPTLYDMIMRNALYFEGAKRGAARDFAKIVQGLDTELLRRTRSLTVASLSDMPKAEFNRFIATLRKGLFGVFEKEDKRLAATLKQLADIQTTTLQKVFRTNTGLAIKRPVKVRQWAKIAKRDVPATGSTLDKAARQLRNSAVNQIETALRRGYIDKKSVQEILTNIRGLKSLGYRNGVLSKISAWADSYFNTVFQHVGSTVSHDVASSYYEEYDWVSILDEGTTDICIERNGNRYRYGEGPIPPAHYGCRSDIVPVDPDNDVKPKRFADWLNDQPGEFLSDVFKNGRTDLDNIKLITLDSFKNKLEFVLVG